MTLHNSVNLVESPTIAPGLYTEHTHTHTLTRTHLTCPIITQCTTNSLSVYRFSSVFAPREPLAAAHTHLLLKSRVTLSRADARAAPGGWGGKSSAGARRRWWV